MKIRASMIKSEHFKMNYIRWTERTISYELDSRGSNTCFLLLLFVVFCNIIKVINLPVIVELRGSEMCDIYNSF